MYAISEFKKDKWHLVDNSSVYNYYYYIHRTAWLERENSKFTIIHSWPESRTIGLQAVVWIGIAR